MKRLWLFILLFLVVGAGIVAWQSTRAIMLVYGRYPDAVPSQLLNWVATPLPTALPAPAVAGPLPTLDLLLPAPVTPTPLPPTFTPLPTEQASSQSTPLPTPTLIPPPPTATATPTLPTAVRLDNLSIIPQKFNNCGPANLSIVLGYHNVDIDQLTIGGVVKPNYDDRNVSPHELVAYVNQNTDLRAASYVGGTIPLLKTLLTAGYPVIIEKGLYPNEWEGWMGHYLTLIGYDDTAQEMISFDTFLGPWDGSGRRDSYDTIEQFWQQFNYTFILVYPPADQGVIDELVGERGDAETMWRQAALTAQQQTEAEPENPYAWFNLGSSLTALAQRTGSEAFYASAAASFDQARTIGLPWRMLWYQFGPYEAYLAVGRADEVILLTDALLTNGGGQNVEETYLYRGHAFAALGDDANSQAAYARAQALNPNVRLSTDE